jgi:hypothetical protein
MPTAIKKNFILSDGLEVEQSIKIGNQSFTKLLDSSAVLNVAQETSTASNISKAAGLICKNYDSASLLPTSGVDSGEFGFVTSTDRLYIWNGSGWYNIALVNTTPTLSTTPDSSYSMDSVGASLSITILATDPEEVPITYSHVASDSAADLVSITQDSGVFTVTPLTQAQLDSNGYSEGGTFTITFKASDGVNIAPAVSSFTLTLAAPPVTNSKYTSALLTAEGTSDNNNIVDASSNSHSLTINGDTTASSVSPYRHGGYSTYFSNSSNSYVNFQGTGTTQNVLPSGTNANFTVEGWFNVESATSNKGVLQIGSISNGDGDLNLYIVGGWAGSVAGGLNYGGSSSYSNGATAANTWVHLAFVKNNGTSSLYKDGALVQSRSDSYDYGGAKLFHIGLYYSTSYCMVGYASNVRISSVARYTGAFTPSTEPFVSDSDTTILTCQEGYMKDASSNDFKFFSSTPVETRAYSPFDNVPYAVADHGGSVYFDGTTDYITIPTLGNSSVTDFTISFWMNTQSLDVNTSLYPRILSIGDGTTSSTFIFYIDTGYRMKVFTNNAVRLESGAGTSTVLRPNIWQHVVLKRNSGTWRLIVDGASQGTYSNSQGINFTSNMFLGKNTTAAGYYTGNISDFKIEFSSTSDSTVTVPTAPYSSTGTELHIKGTEASIIDKAQVSNLKLNGNITGSTTQVKFANTKSIYFDGNGDYIDISSQPILDLDGIDFTVEAWVRLDSLSQMQTLIAFALPHATFQISLTRNGTGNTYVMVGNSNNTSWASTSAIISSNQLSANTWHHVAATVERSTNTIVLYHDGSSVGSTTNSSHMPNYMAGNVRIGSYNHPTVSPGEFLRGYVQDLRVSRYVRYTTNFSVPSAPFEG